VAVAPKRERLRYHARVSPIGSCEVPSGLEDRCRHVTARVADIELELPAPLAQSAMRVLCASQFVLDTLLRYPDALLERLADSAPLTR
jgi:hypothetical protein